MGGGSPSPTPQTRGPPGGPEVWGCHVYLPWALEPKEALPRLHLSQEEKEKWRHDRAAACVGRRRMMLRELREGARMVGGLGLGLLLCAKSTPPPSSPPLARVVRKHFRRTHEARLSCDGEPVAANATEWQGVQGGGQFARGWICSGR